MLGRAAGLAVRIQIQTKRMNRDTSIFVREKTQRLPQHRFAAVVLLAEFVVQPVCEQDHVSRSSNRLALEPVRHDLQRIDDFRAAVIEHSAFSDAFELVVASIENKHLAFEFRSIGRCHELQPAIEFVAGFEQTKLLKRFPLRHRSVLADIADGRRAGIVESLDHDSIVSTEQIENEFHGVPTNSIWIRSVAFGFFKFPIAARNIDQQNQIDSPATNALVLSVRLARREI